jgi:hypothetical protein
MATNKLATIPPPPSPYAPLDSADWREWFYQVYTFLNEGSWPVDSVFLAVVATNPLSLLGFGKWTLLGSATIGTTTIYYWKRVA